MTQQLQFPVSKVKSIEFCEKSHIWFVDIGAFVLECSLIAANLETFYVSCVDKQQKVPDDNIKLSDYAESMEEHVDNENTGV